jgi:hypothetical protein
VPGGQVTLLLQPLLNQPLQGADRLVETVSARRQDRLPIGIEDLPLHGEALNLRGCGGQKSDATGFRQGDVFRVEVQATTLAKTEQ